MFLKKETAPLSGTAGFTKQQIYGNLDLLTLNRSLKQFVRALQFFNRKRGSFALFLKDKSFSFLLSELLPTLINPERLRVRFAIKKTENLLSGRRRANPALLLDKEFLSVNSLKKLQQNKSHLITSIDLVHNIANFGRNHVYNDILSMKKRTLLAVLIHNILTVPTTLRTHLAKTKKTKRIVRSITSLLNPECAAVVFKKKKKSKIAKIKKLVRGVFTKLEVFRQKEILTYADWGPFKKKSINKKIAYLTVTAPRQQK